MSQRIEAEERRREVVAAATALLVRNGRPALTVRNVAAAVGCSTKVVSHHFADMAELLQSSA